MSAKKVLQRLSNRELAEWYVGTLTLDEAKRQLIQCIAEQYSEDYEMRCEDIENRHRELKRKGQSQ
jgi:hypothetical protein